MELNNMKSGLFGFKKSSVYEYIADLNRVCSQKVEDAKKDRQSTISELNAKNTELREKLMCLEGENDVLKREITEKEALIKKLTEENENYRTDTDKQLALAEEIAAMLAEAKEFARILREKSIRENEAFIEENRRKNELEKARLAEYSRKVSRVKNEISSVLEETETKLSIAEGKISALETEADEQKY